MHRGVVGVIVAIIVIVVGGMLYIQKSPTTVTQNSVLSANTLPTQTVDQQTAIITSPLQPKITDAPVQSLAESQKVLKSYYQWYTGCIKQHLEQLQATPPTTHTLQQDCPYETGNIVSNTLLPQLQKASGVDPILCAQSLPQAMSFETPVTNEGGLATIRVHDEFGQAGTTIFDVQMQPVNTQWQIVNVTCPQK